MSPTERAEATIVVCQCNSTRFKVKKALKNSVSLECAKCGMLTNVKGSVALTKVTSDEVSLAITEGVVAPKGEVSSEDSGKSSETKDKGPTLGEQGYKQFRFRVTEEQAEVVRRALEAVRVMNYREDIYQDQTWQGHAIEFMAADFLSGCDPMVLTVVEAQEQAVKEAAVRAEQGGSPMSARQLRDLRRKVREQEIEKLANDGEGEPTEEVSEEPVDEEPMGESPPDPDAKPVDSKCAYLGVAIHDAMEGMEYAVHESLDDAAQFWEAEGGFLLKVLGDERMEDEHGNRPVLYVTTRSEDDFDLPLAYEDQVGEIVRGPLAEVVEMLPRGYSQLEDEEKWSAPIVASRREEMDR